MHFEVIDGPLVGVEWVLGSVVGEEALNELFTFHLNLVSHQHAITNATHAELEEKLIGHSCSLKMHETDITRYGIIASIETEPQREHAAGTVVRMVMRPRAWLMTLRKNTRIFQGEYMHEIVRDVLTDSGICCRWLLQNKYLKRVYCTQYEETDYEFVARILAEEGVYWYFEMVESFVADPIPQGPSTSAWSTVGAIGTAVGAVAGGIAPQISGGTASGIVGTVGSIGSIVGDAATPAVDPEADDPITGATGRGGPATHTATEVFVFADNQIGYISGNKGDAPPLVLRYGVSTTGFVNDSVTALAGTRSAGPRGVEIRDYDFRRPMALLSKKAAFKEVSALQAPMEFYEHHGEYEKPDIEDEQAQIRMEQLRSPTSIIKGESTCPKMMPGFMLDLTQSPSPFRDETYVPVRVRHEAYQGELSTGVPRLNLGEAEAGHVRVVEAVASLLRDLEGQRRTLGEGELRAMSMRALGTSGAVQRAYQNRFEWVESKVVFRPPLPPRIRHAVNESAVVVGPAGKQIYMDAYGRVKVQFQWDRAGAYNENSSCWMRVLSTWAGAGFGFQFFPRVGMEVIVSFLGGDPDRPVISGSVYNATHPTPEPLPQRGTRSGIRSQTVPGGGGFNELSFEDAAGVERVFIHAQKDLHEIVNDGHTTTVRGAQTTTVGDNLKLGVQGNRITAIGGNDAKLVGTNEAAHVGGNRVAHVDKNSLELVHGDALREVRGVSITETVSDDLHVVRGDQNLTVHGRHVLHVVSKKDGPKSTSTTYVDGSTYHTATDKVVIRAQHADNTGTDSSLRLECGESYIELKGDTITVSAKNIVFNSSDTFTLAGKNVDLTGSDHVTIKRSSASVALDSSGFAVGGVSKASLATSSSKVSVDGGTAELVGSSEAHVSGGAVKLMSGSASDSKTSSDPTQTSQPPPTQHLKIAFCHPKGTAETDPIAGTDYRVTSDGFVFEGTTGGDGSIDVALPQGTTRATVILFVDQSDDYKTRYFAPLVWEIQVVDDFHAATDVQGARLRLRNLGYATGTNTDETDIDKDSVTELAIERFQRDQGIRVSGKLDEDGTGTTLNTIFKAVQ